MLACVFVRYMEDNDLIAETYLAGTGDRRRQAEDAHEALLPRPPARQRPRVPARRLPQGRLDPGGRATCSPRARRRSGPSAPRATARRGCWRSGGRSTPRSARLRRSLRVEGGDTRFLGDLYQDLSEAARKKYALLQTPDFVEEFILDRTLTPALDEFGLEAVRLIDPTCGSGHFLLGAFRRLFRLWTEREPATEPAVLAQRALDAVYGVDVNPFAVAIARFRLIVEAMHACAASRRLDRAPGWTVHVAVGDSLMHGDTLRPARVPPGVAAERRAVVRPDLRARGPGRPAGDPRPAVPRVVGNPPYITVKDATLNAPLPRRAGTTCHRQYSLGVPFTERFFDLALAARRRPTGRASSG